MGKQKTRSRLNQVTGQMEKVVLDAVTLAVEYVHNAIDRKAVTLPQADYERFVSRLGELIAGMKRQK